MFLAVLIVVSYHQLVPIILHMHGLWFFKGQIKCLLMFQPNQLSDRTILEGIFIATPIQMQYFIDKCSFLIYQLIDLECLVIDQQANAVSPFAVLSKRNLDDRFASLIDDLVLS